MGGGVVLRFLKFENNLSTRAYKVVDNRVGND